MSALRTAGTQEAPSLGSDTAAMNPQGDQSHRVLVVDDEPNIVDVITMALRFQGFEVASAATGAEALQQVREFRRTCWCST